MSRFISLLPSRLSISNFPRQIHRKTRISLPASDRVLVFHSEYNDPFLNLAYENWMYDNLDFEKHDVLLFWRNSPCVVIGRHQNPWLECNVKLLRTLGVQLVRRYSGGGAVYHDLGNLNITFLTNRARYNRRRNLESVTKALSNGWGLDVEISPRDDILVANLFKISGSAAKLGKHSCYHHCTLLCEADLGLLNKAVTTSGLVATSRSTQSVSAHVVNLKDIEPSITFNEIIIGVVKAYGQVNSHPEVRSFEMFQNYFSEIDEIKSELQSWEWVYGKTSQFSLTCSILSSSGTKIDINVEIKSGIIKGLTITPNVVSVLAETLFKDYLLGTRFVSDDISQAIDKYLKSCKGLLDDRTEKYVREIILCILNISLYC